LRLKIAIGTTRRPGNPYNGIDDLPKLTDFKPPCSLTSTGLTPSRFHSELGQRTKDLKVKDRNPLAQLLAAEHKADALLEAIEANKLLRPGRSETEVDKDIFALAQDSFGVTQHWHKRIVRAGSNTVRIFSEDPPVRDIGDDDTVFLDLGPVFGEWEADVGRTYAMGSDPEKHRLCADLPRVFEALKRYFDDHPDVTGAELYAYAQRCAEDAGWLFGGAIAGHIVGEFPHARIPGDKDLYRISPANPGRLRDPDAVGNTRYWIIEVHLVDRTRSWGGFYERLLVPGQAEDAPSHGGSSAA
jgi:Xaa-Pro dipeptidase